MSHVDHELYELRQRVDRLETQMAHLLKNLGFVPEHMPTPQVTPEILDLVQRGLKIEAIKLYRQQTGAGLKDAKDFIDSLSR